MSTRLRKKRCTVCSHWFQPVIKHQLYCSKKCREPVYKERQRKYQTNARVRARQKNPARFFLYRIKHRAKRLGIPFNLVEADLIFPDACPVLGIKLVWHLGKGPCRFYPDSPSVDRIKPELGYVSGNVRIISGRANLLKSNASISELQAALKDLHCLKRKGKF